MEIELHSLPLMENDALHGDSKKMKNLKLGIDKMRVHDYYMCVPNKSEVILFWVIR